MKGLTLSRVESPLYVLDLDAGFDFSLYFFVDFDEIKLSSTFRSTTALKRCELIRISIV